MVAGKDFEQDVCYLLRLQGWRVRPEHILGHKRIDAYAEKAGDFGQQVRVAVECKDYSSPMSQQQVTQIYANYLPLIQQGFVDQVVLVTSCDIAPSAKTYATGTKGMVHTTYVELLNSLLDFSSYIQGIIAQYLSDEVSGYYVRQEFQTDSESYRGWTAIEDAILHWIATDDRRPLAVLGGYGMGKTSLAKRVAFLLAERHAADPIERIPIMIRLEEFGSEQSLEGLVGKHFTSSAVVRNYNFNVFMELNKRGRFVIFLDGFDEMKQTMTWDTLRFNLQQINRLIDGNPKVILGGRPSVFLNQDEHAEALHGRRQILGRSKRLPGWPDYHEFYLQPFTEEQIREFIESYVSVSHQGADSKLQALAGPKDMARFRPQENSRLFNLAARPVQLRMLLEILPTWDEDIDSLTVTVLYSEFIDIMIRREMEKLSRRQYSADERRNFLRDLAWWMWAEKVGGTVTAPKIPRELFSKFADPDQDLAEVARDLLSACFIAVKQPWGYYFPHRSFHEFLVADKLVSLIQQRRLPMNEELMITPEIQEFFAGLLGKDEHREFQRLVWRHRGVLPDWLVYLLLHLIDEPRDLFQDQDAMHSPWPYLLTAIGIKERKWQTSIPEIDEFLRRSLGALPDDCSPKTEWVRLFVTLNVMLSPYLQEIGCDEYKRISDFLSLTDTADLFVGRRKVPGRRLLEEHITENFCCLSSWTKHAWDFGDQWYSRGESKRKAKKRQKTKETEPRPKPVAKKLPHRPHVATRKQTLDK